ncbi:MAG: GntR family transcriptional regulator [Proteobacteria bacterium]|nr:GntR family transcriptional regulator [Pseudomonadota bacterium]
MAESADRSSFAPAHFALMSTLLQAVAERTLLQEGWFIIPAMNSRFTPGSLTPTLPLQIAERIGTDIVEELFRPGERLKETELAAAFGVSRATVREALRILENRGLVRIQPQRGAQVTLPSSRELENLFEIRAVLLGLASRQAALNQTADGKKRLQAALDALVAARRDQSGYVRASAAMVAVVAALSRNEQLAGMVESFAQRIGRYTRLGLTVQERRDQSIANWRKLVRAIIGGEADLAEATHRRLALQNRDAALEEIERRAPHPRPSRAAKKSGK